MAKQEKFSFWVPAELKKGKNSDGVEEMLIKGIASSATADSDEETLLPSGFDYTPLLTKGFLNWDHQAKKTSAAIIGEPTMAQVVNGGRDFYIEGKLYDGSEEAQSVWKLAQILEKNSKTRRLGFSIEGTVLERGCGPEFFDEAKQIRNPSFTRALWNKITKAKITGVAITPCPKNPNTLMQIIKGETDHLLMSDDYEDVEEEGEEDKKKKKDVEKAFTAEGASAAGLIAEDVEGAKNPNKVPLTDPKGEKPVASFLKKSEIYNLIAQRYTTDVEKAKEIYSLILDTNQKLFQMTNTQVSKEAIEKAFSFLNAASADVIQKSESDEDKKEDKKDDKDEKKDEKNDGPVEGDAASKDEPSEEEVKKAEEEEMKKATDEAETLRKSGLSKGEMIDGVCKSVGCSMAVAQTAVEGVIREAEAGEKNGGIVSAGSFGAGIEKSDVLGILEAISGSTELIKSFSNETNTRFGALGKILKYTVEQNELLKSQVDELQKSNGELAQRLGKVEATPIPSKSVTNAKAAERFLEKSQSSTIGAPGVDVYDLSKGEDVSALSDRMFNEAVRLRQADRPDALLEKSIADFEISKSLPKEILPWLRSRNIAVTMGQK